MWRNGAERKRKGKERIGRDGGKGKARGQGKINEGKGKERTKPLGLLFY